MPLAWTGVAVLTRTRHVAAARAATRATIRLRLRDVMIVSPQEKVKCNQCRFKFGDITPCGRLMPGRRATRAAGGIALSPGCPGHNFHGMCAPHGSPDDRAGPSGWA